MFARLFISSSSVVVCVHWKMCFSSRLGCGGQVVLKWMRRIFLMYAFAVKDLTVLLVQVKSSATCTNGGRTIGEVCWAVLLGFVWGSLWFSWLRAGAVLSTQGTHPALGALPPLYGLSFTLLAWWQEVLAWWTGNQSPCRLWERFDTGVYLVSHFGCLWKHFQRKNTCHLFQKSGLGCAFIIFAEVSPWGFQPVYGTCPLPLDWGRVRLGWIGAV